MTLSEEQFDSLKETAKPLVKWLNENCHPHVVAIVETDGIELHEGVAGIPIKEFIQD